MNKKRWPPETRIPSDGEIRVWKLFKLNKFSGSIVENEKEKKNA